MENRSGLARIYDMSKPAPSARSNRVAADIRPTRRPTINHFRHFALECARNNNNKDITRLSSVIDCESMEPPGMQANYRAIFTEMLLAQSAGDRCRLPIGAAALRPAGRDGNIKQALTDRPRPRFRPRAGPCRAGASRREGRKFPAHRRGVGEPWLVALAACRGLSSDGFSFRHTTTCVGGAAVVRD